MTLLDPPSVSVVLGEGHPWMAPGAFGLLVGAGVVLGALATDVLRKRARTALRDEADPRPYLHAFSVLAALGVATVTLGAFALLDGQSLSFWAPLFGSGVFFAALGLRLRHLTRSGALLLERP